jgi:carbon monoxide dehydrogenase subunit G
MVVFAGLISPDSTANHAHLTVAWTHPHRALPGNRLSGVITQRSEAISMRIEGTHQFNTPIEQVYAALMDPDALRAAIPGCERITQLGPADDTGRIHGEARIRRAEHAAPSTFVWAIEPTRIPRHVRFEARASGAEDRLTVSGFVDLVAREGQTVSAYVWDVEGVFASGDEPAFATSTGTALLKRIGEALDAQVAGDRHHHATVEDALPILRADSARGRITLLPAEPTAQPVKTRLRPALDRGLWAAAGIAVGIAVLAGLAATLSLLRKRDVTETR